MSFKHLKRVKVFSDDLQIGMFVSDLDKNWSDSTFLMQGFTIDSEQDIEAVKSQCEFVYIDFRSDSQFKQYRLATTTSSSYKEKNINSFESKASFLQNKIRPAAERFRVSSHLMKGLMDRIMLGEDFDLHGVREIVRDNVKQVLKNEDAMLMMTLLKNKSNSRAEHSLNVSILAIGFARFLGYSEAQLEDIGMGTLLHDIGQVRVDSKLLTKAGKLNQNEVKEMCQHPKFAFDILQSKSDLTPSCIDIALNHHERLNGKGYPRGLTGEKLSNNVRLVTIVDVFESLTSPQTYRKSVSVIDAYKVLMNGKATLFDERMVIQFVEWRGIYPPGSIVEMENGEVGIVIAVNKKFKLKPKVLLVLDEYKQNRKERIVDLSKMALDGESKIYKIVKAYENSAFGIDLQAYADKGLKVEPVQ
jgi:HD-GYP domain-containing protein (c-di-GMP phosphodiesterase class II)